MIDVKNTQRSLVSASFDGRVLKTFRGPDALQRFSKEVAMLQHLERSHCDFVPRLLQYKSETLTVEMTHCGQPVQNIGIQKCNEVFEQLRSFGIIHDDPCARNITYRARDSRFCVIDFEYSRFLTPGAEAEILSTLSELRQIVSDRYVKHGSIDNRCSSDASTRAYQAPCKNL